MINNKMHVKVVALTSVTLISLYLITVKTCPLLTNLLPDQDPFENLFAITRLTVLVIPLHPSAQDVYLQPSHYITPFSSPISCLCSPFTCIHALFKSTFQYSLPVFSFRCPNHKKHIVYPHFRSPL